MNLATTYLGLPLRTPLVLSASPLTQNQDNIKRLEDAGVAAIVFHSLFEEQIRLESEEQFVFSIEGAESQPEAANYIPQNVEFQVTPDIYLKQIAKAKETVRVPIIGSLNGSTSGGWTRYAREIQQAGADALELNLYAVQTDFNLTSEEIEQRYVQVLRDIKATVTIPVAVKLGPFFTNFGRMAKQLEQAGASGLVLFNRFYQPDIDPEALEVTPHLLLSTPMAMRLPLTWIGLLAGKLNLSLAGTSGIHRVTDVVKMLMAGADVTMLCSVLLRRGITHLVDIEHELCHWLEAHEYNSIAQLKGCLSQMKAPDPSSFERSLYLHTLTTAARNYASGAWVRNRTWPVSPYELSAL
jgi:dihydroorotate dehydrogenase (fumarate)